MFRKFVYLLLIFSVFWQAGSLTTGALTTQENPDGSRSSGHAVVHWQASDHHHHDDGGLHLDDSGGTAEHMQAESIGNAPCLLAANHPAPQTLPSLAPDVRGELGFTSHYLDGLLRPPKARA